MYDILQTLPFAAAFKTGKWLSTLQLEAFQQYLTIKRTSKQMLSQNVMVELLNH